MPTLQPEGDPTAQPTASASQSPATVPAAVSASPAASGSPVAAAAPGLATLLDERFANNARGWPSNAQSTAWLTNGGYRLMTRQADALSEEWVERYQRDAAEPTTRTVNAASDLA